MSLTDEQNAALELVSKRIPVSASFEIPETLKNAGDSPWLRSMMEVARTMEDSAAAYYNIQARNTLQNTKRNVLSAEGFPASVDVAYVTPPLLSYLSKSEPREVKHIVFHSFGRYWHAAPNGKGWMNRATIGEGVEEYEHEGQTVYIAKGSDTETLSHSSRVMSSIQAALGPASRATPHFFVDRSGGLTVVGDVSNIMFVDGAINESSISIALEEAFYLTEDPQKDKATYLEGGTPPGTEGNIQYFAFSAQQLYTLSIVCKKLETAFPNLSARNIDFTRRGLTTGSPDGYTMPDFVKGSDNIDISPHFLTQALWDSFFALMDSQTQINETNVWQEVSKYPNPGIALANAPVSDSPLDPARSRMLDNSRSLGIGLQRSLLKATASKSAMVQDAGDEALAASKKLAQVAANTYNFIGSVPRTYVEEDMDEADQGGWDEEEIW